MGKGNPLVAIRLEPGLLENIDADVFRANRRGRKTETSRSSWIRAAILEKLAHRARSRRSKKTDCFKCFQCKQTFDLMYLAWNRTLLTGGEESCCVACDRSSKP